MYMYGAIILLYIMWMDGTLSIHVHSKPFIPSATYVA